MEFFEPSAAIFLIILSRCCYEQTILLRFLAGRHLSLRLRVLRRLGVMSLVLSLKGKPSEAAPSNMYQRQSEEA